VTPALMYHDATTPESGDDSSGFPGGDAARYKLTRKQFEAHLAAIARRVALPLLTFDDGGVSAMHIADALERHGWRGYFFITTAYLDRPQFLNHAHLRDLHARGHVVGSHSHTHPLRMGACSEPKLRDEWTRSTSILADALGASIAFASVPGGHHTDAVCRTAAAVGFDTLFTSQPTTRVTYVNGMRVAGRYAIQRSTSAATAAALAAGDVLPRVHWTTIWTAKNGIKRIAGPAYLWARARALGASPNVQWGDDVR
jgi:peptidoglycan/xylan/chitin deacetylase (PgdA/CDA1 family)